MSREGIVYAVSGACFGLLVGWLIGSQQAAVPAAVAPVAASPAAAPDAARPAPVLDTARVDTLMQEATERPTDATVRAELGNLYFDAERYAEAIRWYEESHALDATNVGVSTDLGVSYYYTNQPDRALKQFARSLERDPNHTKTILNQGIVQAFGKQDLAGAIASWERVLALAPDTPEGRAARQAIDSLRGAHPGVGGVDAGRSSGGVR